VGAGTAAMTGPRHQRQKVNKYAALFVAHYGTPPPPRPHPPAAARRSFLCHLTSPSLMLGHCSSCCPIQVPHSTRLIVAGLGDSPQGIENSQHGRCDGCATSSPSRPRRATATPLPPILALPRPMTRLGSGRPRRVGCRSWLTERYPPPLLPP